MKTKVPLILLIAMLIASTAALYFYLNGSPALSPEKDTADKTENEEKSQAKKPPEALYIEPVANFKTRVTKKKFGIYITPQTSPVQPERFSGYHTGVDGEYSDVKSDTPVKAITSGIVRYAGYISGYGGVLVIEHPINGAQRAVVYGHLDQNSLPAVGSKVKKGAKIGVLGEDMSADIDGERKHLHFAILKTTTVSYAGYVSSKEQLSNWIDPLSLY